MCFFLCSTEYLLGFFLYGLYWVYAASALVPVDASGFFFFTTLKRAEELTLMELKRLRKRLNGGRGGPRTGPRNALKRKKNAFFYIFCFSMTVS